MKKQSNYKPNQVGVVFLIIIGVASILDNHLSKGWVLAKILAVGLGFFILGIDYGRSQTR